MVTPPAAGILAAQAPDATLILQEPSRPFRTKEQVDHERLIIKRPRRLDRMMKGYAAVGVSGNVDDLKVDGGVHPLGTLTYFSLHRAWCGPHGHEKAVVGIVLNGYKSCFRDGRIELGGADNNVCSYDLRFRPFAGANEGGRILSTQKRPTTIRLGLTLDEAVERVTRRIDEPAATLTLPRFWAAFPADDMPTVEDCPAVRKAVMDAVRPGYVGPVLPSLRSPGGVVTSVCHGVDKAAGIGVGFGGSEFDPTHVVVLPRTAVLRPFLRVGMQIAEGVAIADFLPRRMYPNARKLAEIYGEDIVSWLVQDAVAAADETIEGTPCRRVELCPSQLGRALALYEDVRHMTDPKTMTVPPQVIRMRVPGALRPDRAEAVVDLYEARRGWSRETEPAGQ